MIFLDRTKVKEPAWFRSKERAAIDAKLAKHFALPVDERPQVGRELFPIAQIRRAADEALLEWTHHKCAYCESPLDAKNPYHLDLHRPLRVDDPEARDHYWWLATEWSNLLPSCAKCNTAKRNQFPMWGKRCEVGSAGEALASETPLLLDPSRDRPEAFIVFERDGQASPARAQDAAARARATIAVLQLNRTDLVSSRREIAERTQAAVRLVFDVRGDKVRWKMPPPIGSEALHALLAPAAPYAAAARYQFARMILGAGSGMADETWAGLAHWVRPYVRALRRQIGIAEPLRRDTLSAVNAPPSPRKPGRRRSHAGATRQHPGLPDAASPDDSVAIATPPPALTVDRVKRVSLENFRAIRRVEFELPLDRPKDLVSKWREQLEELTGVDDLAERREWGWKMLLGENGAGKSSIVQAIALALMGREFYERHRAEYGLEQSLREGARRGSIRVELEESAPVEIEVTERGLKWTSRPEGVPVFLRGYGATRLLPRRSKAATPGLAQIPRKVDSLFDPHAPLVDAEGWLRSLAADDFHAAATSLKALLDLPERAADFGFEERRARRGRFGLWRTRGQRRFAAFEPLDHFSAGYQTLLALGCDVLAGSGRTISEARELPGVVLLDEIGTNLHPSWRLAIVRRLGNCFPRLQFIASTHEPLCLRGLGKGEVAVVRRKEDEITLQDDLPSPAGLRVEQLLTSPFFGLDTTADPWLQRASDVYYDLLARRDGLKQRERELFDLLRRLLQDEPLLGSTRREQLLLDAVDQVIAQERKSAAGRPLRASPELREEARRALGELDALGATNGARRVARRPR